MSFVLKDDSKQTTTTIYDVYELGPVDILNTKRWKEM